MAENQHPPADIESLKSSPDLGYLGYGTLVYRIWYRPSTPLEPFGLGRTP